MGREGVWMAAVDARYRPDHVYRRSPPRVDVHCKVQEAFGLEDPVNLIEDPARRLGVVDDVVDDRQREYAVIEREILANALEKPDRGAAKRDQRVSVLVEVFEWVDRESLSPGEK